MKAFIAFFMEKNLVVLAPNKLIILSLPSLSFSMSPKKFWGNFRVGIPLTSMEK